MQELDLLTRVVIVFGITGAAGIFIWMGIVIYLKNKWLTLLEDILDNGIRGYSFNIIFSGHGVLQYATVFLWSFHAKRYGMLEKRKNVPKHIQKWFIFAFCLFMSSSALIVTSIALIKVYEL